RPIQLFTKFTFERINISTPRGAGRLRDAPGWPLRVFRPDDFAHEFGRESGVFMGEFDPDGFTIHDGKSMAKLVADVTTVINLMHGPDEVAIVLVRLARDDSVDPVHARDAAVRIAIKF